MARGGASIVDNERSEKSRFLDVLYDVPKFVSADGICCLLMSIRTMLHTCYKHFGFMLPKDFLLLQMYFFVLASVVHMLHT